MAGGMLFPDIAGALSSGAQAGAASAQGRFLMEDRAARNEIAPLIPKALQGDREALDKIGARHPDTLMKITPLLERADAATRARAKETAEWTTKAAMGVLSLPEAERPAAYQAALADGQRLGYKIDMPPQYDRAVEGRLRMILNQARPIADYFKDRSDGFELVPSGGGGGGGGGGAAPPNRDAFVQTMMPHALEISKATGLDPRLVIAQAALETGYGQRAPGNNLFGVKSHGKPGGQVLATKEAGPGGMYGTRESFRTYSNPGESARDYVDFLKTNSRYAPVLQAQGIDAQIEAMGRSGYASDPQYAAKLRQIVQSLPQPPGLAQGDAAPRGDASGNPIPTSDGGTVPREAMRMITPVLPPGTRLGKDKKTGRYIVQEGHFVVYDEVTRNPVGLIPVPKPKEQGAAPAGYRYSPDGRSLEVIPGGPADKQQGSGPFAGTGMDQQAMNILLRGDPASPEYALAYAHLSKPRTTLDDQGRPVTIQPMDLSAVRKPAGSAAAPAGAPGAAPGGTTTPLPGGGSLTVGEPVAPKGPSAKEVSDLRTARVEAETIIKALEDFRNEFKNADFLTRGKSVMGMTTGLNTSYNVAALLAKGEALFNLGVLNGPDLDIIRRTLPDPATLKGAGTNTKEMDTAVDKVVNLLNTRLSAREKQLGIAPTTAAPAQPQTAKPGTYIGPDNKPVNWPEIEATAKNRGITPDEVINRLGLKPTGMQ